MPQKKMEIICMCCWRVNKLPWSTVNAKLMLSCACSHAQLTILSFSSEMLSSAWTASPWNPRCVVGIQWFLVCLFHRAMHWVLLVFLINPWRNTEQLKSHFSVAKNERIVQVHCNWSARNTEIQRRWCDSGNLVYWAFSPSRTAVWQVFWKMPHRIGLHTELWTVFF